MRTWKTFSGAILAFALPTMGCADTPVSSELVRARTAYEAASRGPAATLEPDRLAAAKQALQRAERAHEDAPGMLEERHRAYIAERSAELATAYAQIAANQRDLQLAAYEYAQAQELARKRSEFALTSSQAEQDERELERQCLEDIQAKLLVELEGLKEQAQVREDQRGLVVTLNGSVLFGSDSANLLPAAKDRLFQVALALQTLRPGQSVVVEGYTDSVGTDEYNQKLSLQRAESVRNYLVSQGVPADRIRAVGHGESSPVTDNDTPAGRANNRRVEIVIPSNEQPGNKDRQQQPMQQQPKTPATKDEPTSRR